ncbi:MAG: hypothetical protein WEA81_01770 [Dehalococcoidia bacterium]
MLRGPVHGLFRQRNSTRTAQAIKTVPSHGGFGLLHLYGVSKPVYRAFQFLHGLGCERLPVAGTHETVDSCVVRKGRSITVLLTNHAQPRHDVVTQLVEVCLTDAPAPVAAVTLELAPEPSDGSAPT